MKKTVLYIIILYTFAVSAAARPATVTYLVAVPDTVRVPIDATEADIHRAFVADELQQELRYSDEGRSLVSMLVYDLTDECLVFSHNPRQTMRPASNQKLVTAITALSVLSEKYQLVTHLNIKGEVSGSCLNGSLFLRGGFDPLISVSDLQRLAEAVRAEGIDTVRGDLVFDVSMKDTLQAGWGWCWDDENPVMSPLLMQDGKTYKDLFPSLLSKAGVVLLGRVSFGRVPSDARRICEVRHKISDILRPMMKDSDNQMAEVLFYHIAASSGADYANRSKAVTCVENVIKQCGLVPADYIVADGSGLSLYNYVTAELMLSLLKYAYKSEGVYDALLESLPIAGVDGTLKKRMKDTVAAANVKAKTGTVKGVSTLSGYATASDGHRYAFSILVNGTLSSKNARDLQDRLCEIMCK